MTHTKPHLLVVAPTQVPPPLQTPGTLAVVVSTHPVAPQLVVLPGNVHPGLLPVQEPAQAPVPPHAIRAVFTFEHVPVEHDWHWPPQATLQQTPSMHSPLMHWLPSVPQEPPLALSGVHFLVVASQ